MLSIWKKRRWYQKDTSLLLRPYAVGQKSLENMHRELRVIYYPNEVDLRSIGLTNQTSLNIAISHIQSSAKEHLMENPHLSYVSSCVRN